MSLRDKLAYIETSHDLTIDSFLSFRNSQLHELRLDASSFETDPNIDAGSRIQAGSSGMHSIVFTAESEKISMLDESKGSTKRRSK